MCARVPPNTNVVLLHLCVRVRVRVCVRVCVRVHVRVRVRVRVRVVGVGVGVFTIANAKQCVHVSKMCTRSWHIFDDA